VTSVDTTQPDPSFVGRRYDASFLEDLPEEVDSCGEYGAFHTFVTDGPPFEQPVPVAVEEAHGDGRMRYARLRAAPERGDEGG
jgi:diphthamide synthase (EF-2-diphthine--ammonia ligase)